MILWVAKHPQAHPDMLGLIPGFLSENDSRPAKAQFHTNYISGWNSFQGFKMLEDGSLKYPGDPPTRLLFEAKFRNETIRFYNHSWVAIVQQDGSFEVARMD